MTEKDLAEKLACWAINEPSIHVLILHGSRVRRRNELGYADANSDWDFQIITSEPARFSDASWTKAAGLSSPAAYAVRIGRLGRVNKISAVFAEGEFDIALLPFNQMLLARYLLQLRSMGLLPRAADALAELAMVLRPGMIVLKGTRGWRRFFERIVAEFAPPRLNDHRVCALAEAFVCDFVSTRGKISRGEFAAAQRWLHLQLAETNFRLLHELRLRMGQSSFPDARRLEFTCQDFWREAVMVEASINRASLSRAVDRAAQVFRELMKALVGENWKWPELPIRENRSLK